LILDGLVSQFGNDAMREGDFITHAVFDEFTGDGPRAHLAHPGPSGAGPHTVPWYPSFACASAPARGGPEQVRPLALPPAPPEPLPLSHPHIASLAVFRSSKEGVWLM